MDEDSKVRRDNTETEEDKGDAMSIPGSPDDPPDSKLRKLDGSMLG